jgi:predicted nucleic acid-binding protein
MPLTLPDSTRCFVDSTIFYYSLVPTPGISDPCSDFLDRIVAGKIAASCSIPVLADVLHKIMMYEAVVKTGRPRSGIVGWLKQHPETLDQLTEHQVAATRLALLPLELLPSDGQLLAHASRVSVNNRLLTNDAIIVASMHQNGITHLVTNDNDFDQVPGITVWKPR